MKVIAFFAVARGRHGLRQTSIINHGRQVHVFREDLSFECSPNVSSSFSQIDEKNRGPDSAGEVPLQIAARLHVDPQLRIDGELCRRDRRRSIRVWRVEEK